MIARYASGLLFLAVLLTTAVGFGKPVTPSAAAHSPSGPSATGNYRQVDSWYDSAAVIPPRIWVEPVGLAITPKGLLFTSDARLRRIEVLSADGTPRYSFGRGVSAQDLDTPGALAVDEVRDRVYVADPGIARVAVYTLAGQLVAFWPGISGPSGIAVAPDGRVAVADTNGDRVRVFAPDGTETASWGGNGSGTAQYDYPTGVDISPDGIVYVADRGNGRVVATTMDGKAVEVYPLDTGQPASPNVPYIGGGEPYDVKVDGDQLWVATDVGLGRFDLKTRKVEAFLVGEVTTAFDLQSQHGMYAAVTPRGAHPQVWHYRYLQATGDAKDTWGDPATVPGYFDALSALTIGHDGIAYLVDVPPRVQKLTLAGQVITQTLSPDPVDADADDQGNLYVAGENELFAYDAQGREKWHTQLHAVIGGGWQEDVVALAWNPVAKQVVVMDSVSNFLFMYDPDGDEVRRFALKPMTDYLQAWTDVAAGPDGRVYALDHGAAQIRSWNLITTKLEVEINLPEPPIRLSVGQDGRMYVLFASGWVRVFTPDGAELARFDGARLDTGRRSKPTDIAVDDGGRVYLVDGLANVVTVYAWDPAAPAESPQTVEAGCKVGGDKTARPSEVRLGETVEVNLLARGGCATKNQKADIALMFQSGIMGTQMARAVEDMFSDIDLGPDLVSFDGQRLTASINFLRRTLRRATGRQGFGRPQGCGGLDADLQAAENALYGNRSRAGVRKVVIQLVHCNEEQYHRFYQPYVKRAAGQLKRRGAEVFALRYNKATSLHPLEDIATDDKHVFATTMQWELGRIYQQIAEQVRPTKLLETLTVTDIIPANMTYVPGSAEPPASVQGNMLVWRLTKIPLNGIGLRYLLRPQEPGDWPTNVVAWGDYVDAWDAIGRLDFPIPRVKVLAPTPTPTNTSTPTNTPTFTPTDEPTATPLPTATATPLPRPVYLPLALNEFCDLSERRLDVALVIDASGSMLELGRSGRPKLDAAREAAGLFLNQLSLGQDQATVVVFNSQAYLLQGLTGDRAKLDAALAAIVASPQTRLDLGIQTAQLELIGPNHRAGNQPIMIVLTDGRANPEPIETAITVADAAKAAGTHIFTIGIGDDLDIDGLKRIATTPADYHQAPDAEDLAAIYTQIGGAIPCRPERFWGGR